MLAVFVSAMLDPRPSRSGAAAGRAHSDDGCDHLIDGTLQPGVRRSAPPSRAYPRSLPIREPPPSRLPGEAKDTSVSADGSGDAIPSSSWQRWHFGQFQLRHEL